MPRSLRRYIKLNGCHSSTQTDALFALDIRQTYVHREIAEQLGDPTPCSRPTSVRVPGTSRPVAATHFIALEFELDGRPIDWSCKVADNLPYPVVIGSAMMSSSRIVLDLINQELIVENDDPVEVLA
jgi:hypothetical protein